MRICLLSGGVIFSWMVNRNYRNYRNSWWRRPEWGSSELHSASTVPPHKRLSKYVHSIWMNKAAERRLHLENGRIPVSIGKGADGARNASITPLWLWPVLCIRKSRILEAKALVCIIGCKKTVSRSQDNSSSQDDKDICLREEIWGWRGNFLNRKCAVWSLELWSPRCVNCSSFLVKTGVFHLSAAETQHHLVWQEEVVYPHSPQARLAAGSMHPQATFKNWHLDRFSNPHSIVILEMTSMILGRK